MKEYEVIKKYKFKTYDEIIEELEKSEFEKDFLEVKTLIKDLDDIKPGENFQKKLKEIDLGYFAYIKFFIDNGEAYGIVAGKTGSYSVNKSQGTDVSFDKKYNGGPARQFLRQKGFEWYKKKIIIIKAHNSKKALEVERKLKEMFGLFGS